MGENDWGVPGNWVEIYQNIFVPAMILEWVPRMLALVDLQPGEKVLDVACGTGALTRAAAQAVGPMGCVFGVDINSDMLNQARKVSDGRYSAIEWRECDAQNLPFEEAKFDVATCQLGLMFMPDKVGALREMRRVLKPSGRAALMVWGRIEACPGQMAMAKAWEKLFGEEQAARFFRQHSLGDPLEVQSLSEAAGFREISVQAVNGTMRFTSAEQLVRSYGALGSFPADEVQQASAIQEVTLALQEYTGPEGLVYPIEAVLAKGVK